jgi:hypothetical protein
MRKRVLVATVVGVGIAVVAWTAANPGRRFGVSTDMLTTYNRLPYPLVDVQVRSDGATRVVAKSHKIGAEQLAWLAQPEPEVLIIASGWQGDARATGWPAGLTRTRVLTLRTGEALRQFNALREQGVRVAIHVHSTC